MNKRMIFLSLIGLGLIRYGYVTYQESQTEAQVSKERNYFEKVKVSNKGIHKDGDNLKKSIKVKPLVESKEYKRPSDTSTLSARSSEQEEKRSYSEAEFDKMEEYFDKVETDWEQGMQSFIIDELGLSTSSFTKYRSLREQYDRAKEVAYNDYQQAMIEKYGEGYEVKASESGENFENLILPSFQNDLREEIGDEAFKQYLNKIDNYNDKLRKEQDPRRGLMLMEF